jgi:nicotinamide phosphoribosyltransferase
LFTIFAPHAADFYKTSHPEMFPDKLEELYGNFTPRGDKLARVLPDFDHKISWVGFQAVLQYLLIDNWNKTFFNKPKAEAIARYKRRMDMALGEGAVPTTKFEALHDLGYLPLTIKALPEGARVDIRVPPYTIRSNKKGFAWIAQYLETQMSAEVWKPLTTATSAYEFRRLFMKFAIETGADTNFVDWQGHDFSMRGMSGLADATTSGAAHLMLFNGTDTISSIDFLEDFYPDHKPVIAGSVPATEHAVSSSNIILISKSLEEKGEWDEWGAFDLNPTTSMLVDSLLLAETAFLKHMLVNKYPSGIFSYVSDTYDYWKVLTEIAPFLKEDIMSREGKVVFRPDSGDPVKIVAGYEVDTLDEAWVGSECVVDDQGKYWTVIATEENRRGLKLGKELTEIEAKGSVQCLWDSFGGTTNAAGYKTIDKHVGLIYGDSISLERATQILTKLKNKGFASDNIVFGIGSFTYQFVTRDTFGTAIKATHARIDGRDYELFKDPKTDSGMKKSARGLIRIELEDGHYVMYDQQTREQEAQGELQVVFENSQMVKMYTANEVRDRLRKVA